MLSPASSDSEETSNPESVLPASCLVAAVRWEIESLVRTAQETEPGPADGPPNLLCPLCRTVSSTSLDPHLPLLLSPRYEPYAVTAQKTLLVAVRRG